MNRMRAWGFTVGVVIAWSIGLAVALTRLGEAHRRQSIFVAAPHSNQERARDHVVR